MNLYIRNLEIKNFKSFEYIKIYPNKIFNIIIGENNAGKSTIFEAFLLWEKCYDTLIKSNGKEFYKASGSANYYISFQDLYFLRITNDTDLFNGRSHTVELTVIISNQTENFELGFKIIKPQTIKNAFYRVKIIKQREFDGFAKYINQENIKLKDAIFIYQTRPVANILQNEPFMNKGQVKKKIKISKSQEVLRNKIISKNNEGLRDLEKSISDILGLELRSTVHLKI